MTDGRTAAKNISGVCVCTTACLPKHRRLAVRYSAAALVLMGEAYSRLFLLASLTDRLTWVNFHPDKRNVGFPSNDMVIMETKENRNSRER